MGSSVCRTYTPTLGPAVLTDGDKQQQQQTPAPISCCTDSGSLSSPNTTCESNPRSDYKRSNSNARWLGTL